MPSVKCHHCGAVIDPDVVTCPFCKVTTAAGIAARRREEHDHKNRAAWDAHASAQEKAAWQLRVANVARQSLFFSLAGFVLCCLPGGIAGVVQGLRARAIARKHNLTVPASATIGLVLGLVSLATSVSAFVYVSIEAEKDRARASARVAELELQIQPRAADAELTHETACALAEKYLLERGHDGKGGSNFRDIECPGRVHSPSPDRAQLDDFRFAQSKNLYELSVCLKRGNVWFVTELRKGPCGGTNEPTPPPSASDTDR